MPDNAVLYLRVSTEEQVNGSSLDAQLASLTAYCTMQNLVPSLVLREEGVSGTIPIFKRPKGSQLINLIQSKQITHIVSIKLDRLFRSASDALSVMNILDEQGIALHLVEAGGTTINTSSATGKLMLQMMGVFAEFERNLIAERIRTSIRHKKNTGQVFNHTPYGYSRQGDILIEEPNEQRVIAEIHAMRGAGLSMWSIAESLNSKGTLTKKGRSWAAQSVKNILTRTNP